MVSDKAKEYLRKRFGDHNYDYEMSDINLESIIEDIHPKTFEELDRECRHIEMLIRDIRERQERMKA